MRVYLFLKNPSKKRMIIPIRCFTCGKVIGNKWDIFKSRTENEEVDKVLSELGMKRYCCRRMFLGQIEKKIEDLQILTKKND